MCHNCPHYVCPGQSVGPCLDATTCATIGGMGRAARAKRERETPEARRVRKQAQGLVRLPNGQEAPWEQVYVWAQQSRRNGDEAEALAVETARALGVSWDRIAALNGGTNPSGERLRRVYGGKRR